MSTHKWYAIQTYAGSEMAVKRAIENLVKITELKNNLKKLLFQLKMLLNLRMERRRLAKEVCIQDMFLHFLI